MLIPLFIEEEDDDDDCFYIALFSAREQTHCAHVSCDSERVTLAFQSTYNNVWLYNTNNRKKNDKKKKKKKNGGDKYYYNNSNVLRIPTSSWTSVCEGHTVWWTCLIITSAI